MKKLLILILLTLTGCSGAPKITEEQNIKRVSLANVKQISLVTSQGTGYCSSVFIKYKNKVRQVTAGHCCNNVSVMYEGKSAQVIKLKTSHDLCELSPSQMPKSGMNIQYKNPELGDKMYFAGFPQGHYFSISQGFITDTNHIFSLLNTNLFKTNAFAFFGNSGGAAINADGRFIGILSITSHSHSHGSFVPVETVIKFLDE